MSCNFRGKAAEGLSRQGKNQKSQSHVLPDHWTLLEFSAMTAGR